MPDHSDAFNPFDLSLKIPLWSKLGSCIHSHFHFLIAVELANSNCDCDSHQSVPPIMPHPNASILYKDSQCNHHHHYRSTNFFEFCSIFCHTTLLLSHNLILLWTGCELNGEMCDPFNWIKLWPSVQGQVSNVIAIAHQLIPWISDSCIICCMLPVLQLLPPLTKGYRAFLTEHAAH
jgi:hypothetical protein